MAEEEKDNEEGAEDQEEEPKKSKKMLFIVIGLIVVLLAGIGVGSFMFLGGGDAEGGHEADSEDEHTHYATFELDPIIVNLSESTSFLKLTMVVEYDPEILALADTGHGHGGGGGGGGEEEVPVGGFPGSLSERQPMIKDALIRVMSSKTAEELLSIEGKELLKEELIEAMNDATGLDEGPIVNIYFIDFIIQ